VALRAPTESRFGIRRLCVRFPAVRTVVRRPPPLAAALLVLATIAATPPIHLTQKMKMTVTTLATFAAAPAAISRLALLVAAGAPLLAYSRRRQSPLFESVFQRSDLRSRGHSRLPWCSDALGGHRGSSRHTLCRCGGGVVMLPHAHGPRRLAVALQLRRDPLRTWWPVTGATSRSPSLRAHWRSSGFAASERYLRQSATEDPGVAHDRMSTQRRKGDGLREVAPVDGPPSWGSLRSFRRDREVDEARVHRYITTAAATAAGRMTRPEPLCPRARRNTRQP